MPADIQESIELIVPVANDENAFLTDADSLIRAHTGNGSGTSNANPHLAEDTLLLQFINCRVIVVAARKSGGEGGFGTCCSGHALPPGWISEKLVRVLVSCYHIGRIAYIPLPSLIAGYSYSHYNRKLMCTQERFSLNIDTNRLCPFFVIRTIFAWI